MIVWTKIYRIIQQNKKIPINHVVEGSFWMENQASKCYWEKDDHSVIRHSFRYDHLKRKSLEIRLDDIVIWYSAYHPWQYQRWTIISGILEFKGKKVKNHAITKESINGKVRSTKVDWYNFISTKYTITAIIEYKESISFKLY